MSVAQEFAELYYDYMSFDNGYLSEWVNYMNNHEADIKEIIVSLYWKISESYDMMTHAPVPDNLWIPYMTYNICNLIDYVQCNYQYYDINTFKHEINGHTPNPWRVTVDPAIVFGVD